MISICLVGRLRLIYFSDILTTLAVVCVLVGVTHEGTRWLLMALLTDLVREEWIRRAAGTNNLSGDVGGGFDPIVSLSVINVFGFLPVSLTRAILSLLAAVILVVVRKETGRFLASVET